MASTLIWSLPLMMRKTSRMSSVRRTCAMAIPLDDGERVPDAVAADLAAPQHAHPAERRGQGRAQFVREHRQEIVPGAVGRPGLFDSRAASCCAALRIASPQHQQQPSTPRFRLLVEDTSLAIVMSSEGVRGQRAVEPSTISLRLRGLHDYA